MTTDDNRGRSDSGQYQGFTTRDVFDPDSEYSVRRACYKPELKLHGLFYEIKSRKKAASPVRRKGMIAMPPLVSLVVYSDEPERALNAVTDLEFFSVPFRDEIHMHLDLRLDDQADQPETGTSCRAFLLTEVLIAQLCGLAASRSPSWARAAIQDVLRGATRGSGEEVSRMLAAAPEVEGRFGDHGVATFTPFTLPKIADDADPADIMAVVIVIERDREEEMP